MAENVFLEEDNRARPILVFIIISLIVMFIVMTLNLSMLRVPLMLSHIFIPFLYKPKIFKADAVSFVFVVLILFFIIQCIYLKSPLLIFSQSVCTVLLYLTFYWYSRVKCTVLFREDLDKMSFYLSFVLPICFISFGSWSFARSGGVLANPNITAHTALNLLPIMLVNRNKKFQAFVYVAIFALFLYTASRSALLAMAMGIIVFYISNNLLKGRISMPKAILLLLGVVLLSWHAVDISFYIIRILSYFIKGDSHLLYEGYSGRDVIWDMAIRRWQSSPYIGVGFDGAKFEMDDHIFGTHNSYIELLLKIGIIGVTILIVLMLIILAKICASNNRAEKSLALMSLAILLSLSTNSSVFFVFNYYFFYFLIILGISQALIINKAE